MNPQMIKKIVPLLEIHLTILITTSQDFEEPMCPGIFISINEKITCRWNMVV